jgi:uncharacterized protein
MNNSALKLLARVLMLPDAGSPHPQRVAVGDVALQPAPIDPAQVLAGSPVAESAALVESADACFTAAVWACTPGKFRWFYRSDEIIHVLEGEARVECEQGGAPLELRAGDLAIFPIDTSAVWEIRKRVKKIALFRSHPSDPLGRVRAKLTKRR